eukprot:12805966-Prorocentrum_lima.AAC.1
MERTLGRTSRKYSSKKKERGRTESSRTRGKKGTTTNRNHQRRNTRTRRRSNDTMAPRRNPHRDRTSTTT